MRLFCYEGLLKENKKYNKIGQLDNPIQLASIGEIQRKIWETFYEVRCSVPAR